MAKRAVLPEEKQVDEGVVRGLQPRLEHRHTVDVVRFQDERHWGSVLRGGDLAHALSVIRDIMMHEMREGYAVSLPGIGTFRPRLKGQVEVRDGKYHGRNVRVDDILFQPERELRQEMCRFEVEQEPYGAAIEAHAEDVGPRLPHLRPPLCWQLLPAVRTVGIDRPLLLQECLPALHFASYGDRGRHIRFDVYIQLFNSSDTVRQRHASPLAHTNPWKPRKQNPKR